MEESTNDSYPDGHVNVAHQLDFPPLEKNYQVASKQPISSKRKRHISKAATHLEVYSNDYYPDGNVHGTESLHLENQHPDNRDQDNNNKHIASKRRCRIPKVYTPNGSEHMRKSSDFCTFRFNRHYVNKQDSRKRNNTYVFIACEQALSVRNEGLQQSWG